MISETEFRRAMMKATALIDAEIQKAERKVAERIDAVAAWISEAERDELRADLKRRLDEVRPELLEFARAAILAWRPDGDGEPVPLIEIAA